MKKFLSFVVVTIAIMYIGIALLLGAAIQVVWNGLLAPNFHCASIEYAPAVFLGLLIMLVWNPISVTVREK